MKVESLIEESEPPMALSRAILLYESKAAFHTDLARDLAQLEREAADGESIETPHGSRALASLHEIHTDQTTGRPVIGAGQPLERRLFEEVMAFLAGNAAPVRELLPENLLFADSGRLLWWTPASRRTIYFSTADKDFNRAVNGKMVAHPALLFLAQPSMLSVWALETSKRPALDTALWRGPYCNLYENGSMCRGDVALPATLGPSGVPAWEKIFFDSRFTHSNLGGKMTRHRGGHNGLWRALVGAESFDVKWLMPTELKVEDVLK